jgi:hypothetical protein
MLNEDPFDRWCRNLLELGYLATMLVELLARRWCRRLLLYIHIFALYGRHFLFVVWCKVRSFFYTWYRRHLCQWLMVCGLMKVPTWTEVEAYRLQISARSGVDIPRPLELENGLRQERMGWRS